jgi:hypothetical protein
VVDDMVGLLETLAPLIATIAVGFVLARTAILSAAGEAGLSAVVFHVATPALLFRAMAGAAPALDDLRLMAAYFLPCLGLYAAWVWAALRCSGQGLGVAAVGAMGGVFGNTVLLGVPLVGSLHGPPGLRVLVLIVSVHSALLFTLTSLLAGAGDGRRGGDAAWRALRGAAANPIVLSIAAGAAWASLGSPLPRAIDATLALLGAATTPLALIAVGVSLAGLRLGAVAAPCAAIAGVKLVALPLAVWASSALLFGLDPLTVAVATLAAALPTGTNVHVLARRSGTGTEIAAGAIFLSTLAAAATVPVTLAILAG